MRLLPKAATGWLPGEAQTQELDAAAVINFNLKYCHPFLYEAPLYKKALAKREIPTNVLEVGHEDFHFGGHSGAQQQLGLGGLGHRLVSGRVQQTAHAFRIDGVLGAT